MAIRTKEYRRWSGGRRARAIRITEKNLSEIVAFICRNGGAATGHNGDTASGRPARIRIKQLNHLPSGTKRDWRVARVGDFVVKYEDGEFARIKADDFEAEFVATK